jgi:hypothetical protein
MFSNWILYSKSWRFWTILGTSKSGNKQIKAKIQQKFILKSNLLFVYFTLCILLNLMFLFLFLLFLVIVSTISCISMCWQSSWFWCSSGWCLRMVRWRWRWTDRRKKWTRIGNVKQQQKKLLNCI